MTFHNRPSYYLRDYLGKIPPDAVPGGLTIDGRTTYIGHVFSKAKASIIPTTIYPNQQEVYFEQHGVQKADNFVQILCSDHKHAFRWVQVNQQNFHLQTISHNLVRGGSEDGKIINIGRIQYQGETVVGKIVSFSIGSAKMWFVHGNQGHEAAQYEVLTL